MKRLPGSIDVTCSPPFCLSLFPSSELPGTANGHEFTDFKTAPVCISEEEGLSERISSRGLSAKAPLIGKKVTFSSPDLPSP
jgi:hypothetical protein